MATTEEQSTPARVQEPTPADRMRQQRQMALYAVLGFLVLVFLILVAFGSPNDEGPVTHDLGDMRGKGLAIAVDDVNGTAGWDDPLPYDATGQDRSLRDRRDWQVCFQRPGAGQGIEDKAEPQIAIDNHEGRGANDVWLGAVRTDEECGKLGGDFGLVPRVYDRDNSDGTNTVPNLYGFTAHMARVAFGDDASIRVRAIPDPDDDGRSLRDIAEEALTGDKAIKADDADEVGSGWDNWKVCNQSPAAGEPWDGKVINLDAVRYDEPCREL